MLSHLRPPNINPFPLLDGGMSVLVFFIISGFYMSLVLSEKYSKLQNGRRRFLINRILRIYPLYLIALIMEQAELSFDGMKTVFTSDMGYSPLTHWTLISMNLLKLGQDYWQMLVEAFHMNNRLHQISWLQEVCLRIFGSNAFDAPNGALLVGQGWSLASELTYYFLAPILISIAWYRLALIGGVSFLIRIAFLVALGMDYMESWRTKFFPSILVFFLIGQLSYWIYRKIRGRRWIRIGQRIAVVSWIAVFAFTLWNRGLFLGSEYDGWQAWMFYGFVLVSIPFLFSATKDSRFDAYVGLFSYPIYLIHPIIIEFDYFHMHASPLGHYLNILIGAFSVSLVLILLVERPVDRLRGRLARK